MALNIPNWTNEEARSRYPDGVYYKQYNNGGGAWRNETNGNQISIEQGTGYFYATGKRTTSKGQPILGINYVNDLSQPLYAEPNFQTSTGQLQYVKSSVSNQMTDPTPTQINTPILGEEVYSITFKSKYGIPLPINEHEVAFRYLPKLNNYLLPRGWIISGMHVNKGELEVQLRKFGSISIALVAVAILVVVLGGVAMTYLITTTIKKVSDNLVIMKKDETIQDYFSFMNNPDLTPDMKTAGTEAYNNALNNQTNAENEQNENPFNDFLNNEQFGISAGAGALILVGAILLSQR